MTRLRSKVCSFIVAVTMLVFVLPTSLANAQTKTLSDAIIKTSMVTSMESSGKLNLTFKAEGLSEQEQEDFAWVSEILNNLHVDFNVKVSGNSDGTVSREYINMTANVGGNPYSGELWSDMNLTGKTPVVKGIVKSPQLFEMMLSPEYMEKYMLLDFQQIKDMPELGTELGSLDFMKIMSENKELQQAILTLIGKYSSQLSSGYDFISKEGNVYKVKIDDATFKDIIRKVINLTAKNKEIQDIIMDLMLTQMKNNGSSTEEINSTKVDMEQMFTTLESQEFLDEFNQIMDKLKDVNILGDKGIDITYTVDENGYVISTKGVIELVADMAKIEKAFGESANVTATEAIPTGIYTVGIYFEENNSNINGEVDIVLPTLTSENSFTMEELLGELQLEPEPEAETEPQPQPQPVIVTETITGGQLPKTSTHLYELLLMGAVLTLTGALTCRSRKRYE
jgi:hypothetical protein